jgi:hypothetical protein
MRITCWVIVASFALLPIGVDFAAQLLGQETRAACRRPDFRRDGGTAGVHVGLEPVHSSSVMSSLSAINAISWARRFSSRHRAVHQVAHRLSQPLPLPAPPGWGPRRRSGRPPPAASPVDARVPRSAPGLRAAAWPGRPSPPSPPPVRSGPTRAGPTLVRPLQHIGLSHQEAEVYLAGQFQLGLECLKLSQHQPGLVQVHPGQRGLGRAPPPSGPSPSHVPARTPCAAAPGTPPSSARTRPAA